MKICIPISYSTPNVSGLTLLAKELANSLVQDGHEVTVVTSKLRDDQLTVEKKGNLTVIRLKPFFRISKLIWIRHYENILERIVFTQDLIFAQIPMMPQETLSIARISRRLNKPLVAMYHCDVKLGTSLVNHTLSRIIERINTAFLSHCKSILVTTIDYAENSTVLKRHLNKCVEIPLLLPNQPSGKKTPKSLGIRKRISNSPDTIIIGCVARIAAEKGINYLIQTIPILKEKLLDFKIVLVGDSTKVLGEHKYKIAIEKLISDNQKYIIQLGYLSKEELIEFYTECDLTVLPSINSTESFGLTQIESMLVGTPVVATKLPGVRQAILRTGMGKLVEIANVDSLADGILQVIQQKNSLTNSPDFIKKCFNMDNAELKISSILKRIPKKNKSKLSLKRTIDNMLRHSPPFTAMVRGVETMILNEYQDLKYPLLDLGCENGTYSQYALNSGIVCSIDKRFIPLKEAQLNLLANNVIQADACTLPFADESFETIVCNSVLEHIPNLQLAIAELYRVLKKEGKMFVTMPNDNFAPLLFGAKFLKKLGLRDLGTAYESWFNQKSQHYHYYSTEKINSVFIKSKFHLLESKEYLSPYSHQFFDLLHYMSVPRLFTKKVLGEWVPFPALSLNFLYSPIILSLIDPKNETPNNNIGPYTFLELKK